MDRDSFIVYVKTDNVYKDIAENVGKNCDTSNFELERPFPKGKNKKVMGLMKDELGRQIMKEVSGIRVKAYIFLNDNNNKDKKIENTKQCVIKRKLKFEDYESYLEAAQIEIK